MEIRVTQLVAYGNHIINASGVVKLTLRAQYSELQNSVRLLQLLHNDIRMLAKFPDEKKPVDLGWFRVDAVNIAGDGTSRLKFSGITDSVETDHLNLFPLKMDAVTEFRIRYSGEVDMEEEENG